MGPEPELAAETRADEVRMHFNLARVQVEVLGQRIAGKDHALGGFMHDQTPIDPARRGGVHFHGVMGFYRRGVGGINLDLGAGISAVGVAAFGAVGLGLAGLAALCQVGGSRRCVVAHLHPIRGIAGLLERIGHHEGHELPGVMHFIVFEGRTQLVDHVFLGKAGR